MESQKNNKGSLFSDATMDPITQRYIHSKYKLAEGDNTNLEALDLRHMCENVVEELQSLESEAAYDYLKVEGEMRELDSEIDRSDSILAELEGVLENFRDHLNEIKGQMTVLQDRSLKMNVSLTNRKNLQKLMNTFMDSAVLDPKLIDAINSAPIDTQYVQHIKVLCQKLEYLQNTRLPDATVVRELEPELNKLKNKACGRVREFLLEKINILKKPMTNVESQQKNVLLEFRVLTEFLKQHYEEIYTELCNTYASVMSSVYLQLFKKNIGELQKFWVELYTKNDTVISDTPALMRTAIAAPKGVTLTNIALPSNEKSIFDLMGRDSILSPARLGEDIIFYLSAQKQNQKFTIEQIFRSLSKLILNTVVSEIAFSSAFFNLTNAQNSRIFKDLFSKTFACLYDFLRSLINESFDCNGLILIFLVNDAFQAEYSDVHSHSAVLQEYFNTINMMVWPRFDKVFEAHRKSMEEKNLKVFKLIEKAVSYRPLVQRYADIAISFYTLYSYFGDNRMLCVRIQFLRKDFFALIKKNAMDIGKGLDRCTYLLLIYDIILSNLTGCTRSATTAKKEFQEELRELEKETAHFISEFINIFLKELFGDLIDFINVNLKEENLTAMKNLGEDLEIAVANQNKMTGASSVAGTGDLTRLVQAICADFNASRNTRIETFKKECERIFRGTQVLKKILKKFLNIFISYYGTFYRYAYKNHPNLAATLIKDHEIMREIQSSYAI